MESSGPERLGRGVVVLAGAEPPREWAGCDRVGVGSDELESPATVVATLHEAWLERHPVVVELEVDLASLRAPEACHRSPHELSPGFEFSRERLQFLLWANNYDARSGAAVWWHGRKAARSFAAAGVQEGGPADLILGDGTPVFVDGGPSHPPPLPDGTGVVTRWNAEGGSLRLAGHAAPAAELAPDQLAAVDHARGPARVIAPAGSGKTRVLTERLRHLVVGRGAHPASITALAFNTKAADELRQRCSDFVSRTAPQIRTLNSLGLWICNEHGPAGRSNVLEERNVRDVIQQVFAVRRQANADTVAPYIAGLSAIRLGLSSPQSVEDELPDATGLAEGFDRYRQALDRAGALDFDEQIYRAIEILLTDPAARAATQQRCRYLLVDEFQDLTPAHVLLIRLLCAPSYDCYGVGDDDQVIYGYAGADPKFLLEYGRYFPGAGEHALEVNYRCPAPVVEAVSHLLSYNYRRVPKAIRAADGRSDGSIEVCATAPEQMPAAAVQLLRTWRDEGVAAEDMALLARVNSALLPVQVACVEAGLPCTMPVGADVLGRTGVRTALAYLRIGLDPGRISSSDVNETIRRPSRGIAPMVVDMLTKARGTSLADIRRLAERLSGRDVPKLTAYADDISRLSEACGGSTARALRAIRVGIGLDDTMDLLDSSRKEADRSTHTDDLIALESVAQLHPDPATFETWLRSTFTETETDGPRVLLSTIHRVKGREWPRVIVFGASAGLLPHRLSDDIEGERRVFHVAITRGKDRVVVIAPDETPSIFVAELDGTRRHEPAATQRRADTSPRRESSEKSRRPGRARTGATDPAVPAGPPSPARAAAEQALRSWRRAAASRDGVPPFVILSDRELVGIAERRPATLRELSRCPGIGPIRLDRWGDEMISVLDGASTAEP